ncbi:MAG TPA: DMT family transporter [Candidatus Krumholzibacteriaceae bacterium]
MNARDCSIQFRLVRTEHIKSYNALTAGIIAISFGAIFTRLAHAPAPAVAALRMIFSALILTPVAVGSARTRGELAGVSRKDGSLLVLSGLFLALHFSLWILSLVYTTVASSVVFVTTNPLWVALFSIAFLREKISRMFWVGLALSIAGGAVIGGGDAAAGHGRWQGDALALGGAIAIAGYFIVGSRLRKRLSLAGYVFPVYACAAVLLFAGAVALRVPLVGYRWETYLYCFLMALVCQILGHSLFNWVLKNLPATVVAIAVLGEPVGATILALLILHEVPGVNVIVGGACILAGVFVALYYGPKSPADRRIASGG